MQTYDRAYLLAQLFLNVFQVKNEQTVFEVISQWVNKDLPKRKQYFPLLFKSVRLQYIPIKYVAGVIRKDVSLSEVLKIF